VRLLCIPNPAACVLSSRHALTLLSHFELHLSSLHLGLGLNQPGTIIPIIDLQKKLALGEASPGLELRTQASHSAGNLSTKRRILNGFNGAFRMNDKGRISTFDGGRSNGHTPLSCWLLFGSAVSTTKRFNRHPAEH
jgi:hypothetical protein